MQIATKKLKSKPIKISCFSLKENVFSFIILLFIISLILFSQSSFSSAKSGILLWANSVLPALFPFLIATELIYYTNIIYYIGMLLNKFMKPLFNVPGIGAYPFILGLLSGYPIGAKLVSNLKKDNLITSIEAERLISFCNNSGPLFIISTIGIGLFANTSIGVILLIAHILSSVSVGLIFRFWRFNDDNNVITTNKATKSYMSKLSSSNTIGEILSTSILSSINTILLIGGFVVLFSVILALLNNLHILDLVSKIFIPIFSFLNINLDFCTPFLSGFLEITNGIKQISTIHIKAISINILLSSFLLGFGGISVLFQVLSITSKAHISIKPYILGKLMQGVFAALYTYLIFNFFPFLSLDI